MTSAGPTTIKYAALAGTLALCLTSGCGSLSVVVPWKKMPLDASAGFYESASILYRLDAGKMEQPLDVARVEGQKILFEQVASSPLADQSIGTLSVTYPHPGGRPGVAQAKFAIDSTAAKPPKPAATRSWNPLSKKRPAPMPTALVTSQPEIHETWVLDIPAAESDQYFKLLAAQSFYNTERPGTGAAQLTVTINGNQVQKPWEPVPQLGALAQRVRREGRLVAYSRPAAQAGVAEGAIASLEVYRNLLAQTASPEAIAAATANLAANPFSMPPVAAPPLSQQVPAVAGAPANPPRR